MKKTLEDQGILGVAHVHWNLDAGALYRAALNRREARESKVGPLVVVTGQYTGRSPNDKFIVEESSSRERVGWGKVNRPISEEKFNRIHQKVLDYLRGKELFVQDCYVGNDPKYRVAIRVITEFAWQSLFARNMFVRIEDEAELARHVPEYTVIAVPGLKADPATDGTHSEAFIIPHFGKKLILIGGTSYAGEIKKSVFSLMNYILPQRGVLSMHCSANIGSQGDVAVFFGLSGTGKTTLSADPERQLIGDDEHGWSEDGVFNFEGGCYAKVIRLSQKAEPEIYATTKRRGTILENVVMDAAGNLDLNDDSLTENTRASYPIDFIPNTAPGGRGGHAKNVIMLTCDAYGVLPPVARLSKEQARYYFLSGYTSKVAGTERGIKEPQATFSSCFGAPFMTLPPQVYTELLCERLEEHQADCWLVNTGWSGGGYGVGTRMSIADSRAIIRAIVSGELTKVKYEPDPFFGFSVPTACPGISSSEVLKPRNAWKDKEAYDRQAKKLIDLFEANFEQFAEAAPLKKRA